MGDPQSREAMDVSATVEQIRRQVRQRREGQPQHSPHQLQGSFDAAGLSYSLEEVRATQGVSAHWPITWKTPLQAFFAFLQRLTRLFLRWYINPIVEQQNVFNAATERTLSLLIAANTRLREEVAALREQLRLQEERAGRPPVSPEDRDDV